MTGEVSPAGQGGLPAPGSELRASHEDRDKVVEQLTVAAGDGRLTAAELDERLELALTARTYRELAVLTADLPAAGAGRVAPASPAPEQRDLMRINIGSGHTSRDGRWVLPKRLEVKLTSGHVVLDFTQAVITGPVLQVSLEVRSGHVTLICRPGIEVHTDDVEVRSGHVHSRLPWGDAGPAELRIEVSGRIRSGSVKARPPRRTFWQWLSRAPRPYAIARL